MSAAAFTDSTTPATSPFANVRPTSGRSTKTTSPSASCACSVMPTVAASWSSMLIHSWSGVYMVVMGRVSCWGSVDGKRSAAVIAVRHEGHRGDAHRLGLVAHVGVDLVMRQRMVGREVGHRDRLVQRRRQGAAGHVAELVALGVADLRAFTNRNALEAEQAQALGRRNGGELAVDDARTGVAAVAL